MSKMNTKKPTTSFATATNPFTGKPVLKEVPIPAINRVSKGMTKYDAEFDKLVQMKSAIEFPERNFQSVRRALQRYILNKDLRGKVAVRQAVKRGTGEIIVWLEKKDEVPRVRSVDDGGRDKKAK
jgi:hypothetical protein